MRLRDFFKHKYIKEIKFNENKTVEIIYHKLKNFKPNFLIDPNHIFNHRGYNTFLHSDVSAQSVNPLDFKSAFNAKDFATALESKLIKETFSTMKEDKVDIIKILLFINTLMIAGILYFFLYGSMNG